MCYPCSTTECLSCQQEVRSTPGDSTDRLQRLAHKQQQEASQAAAEQQQELCNIQVGLAHSIIQDSGSI